MVLHLWGLPDSDRLLERNLAVLPQLIDITEGCGLALSIEALLCELSTPVDTVARCLATDRRTKITLDTAFLAMHGQLGDALTDDRLWTPGAVDHVHLKDGTAARSGDS